MPVCKKCRTMRSSAEMRETVKSVKVDFEKAGKAYPGLETHWVCFDKRRCREIRDAENAGRMAVREDAEALQRLRDA